MSQFDAFIGDVFLDDLLCFWVGHGVLDIGGVEIPVYIGDHPSKSGVDESDDTSHGSLAYSGGHCEAVHNLLLGWELAWLGTTGCHSGLLLLDLVFSDVLAHHLVVELLDLVLVNQVIIDLSFLWLNDICLLWRGHISQGVLGLINLSRLELLVKELLVLNSSVLLLSEPPGWGLVLLHVASTIELAHDLVELLHATDVLALL